MTESHPNTAHSTDILIIGAGPVGLFAAFQVGVLGMQCVLIDALDRPGGQCTELYPEKPIYDIPALPVCTAQELVDRLLEQCRPFGFPIHTGQRAMRVEQQADGRYRVTTEQGMVFDAAVLLIAAGAGAFVPQRVALPEAAALEGDSLHYAVRDMARFAGKRIVIAGGGDSALDWVLALRKIAAHTTLLHRRDNFRAADASVAEMRGAVAAGEMDFVVGMLDALQTQDGRLTGIVVKHKDGTHSLPCDDLIALYGLVTDPGPLANWGLDMQAGRIVVDTTAYETNRPGIFAVGDIALYPNRQKLILSGFHEAALALRKAYRVVYPDKTLVHVHTSNNATLRERIQHS
ncbi:NAD(P)/FAD-dependent oxidoreductase [Imbroritus primus]|uniref:NAD(P)/FAD-dependent oxidoreductase n=1 Tax=Imbroritus primus TaxID=3058603 RepID=A0ACD3STT1_9BURK|nr:NAD(P)/FAD-dependent oxidoreductase [Burkholderiaceae bacterium PBA]